MLYQQQYADDAASLYMLRGPPHAADRRAGYDNDAGSAPALSPRRTAGAVLKKFQAAYVRSTAQPLAARGQPHNKSRWL